MCLVQLESDGDLARRGRAEAVRDDHCDDAAVEGGVGPERGELGGAEGGDPEGVDGAENRLGNHGRGADAQLD